MKTGSMWRLALGAIAILVVAEGALRWGVGLGDPPLARLDPVTEYELVGPAVYHRWGNEIAINSQGMRAPHLDPAPAPNERRVVLIGDSVIYGGHFIDQSETIAAHMTQIFAADPALAGCTAKVLPVAVSSWGPVNQAGFLKRSGHFGADVAGIVVSAHDLYDVPQGGAAILPYRTTAPITAIGDAAQAVLERLFPKEVTVQTGSIKERARATLSALDDMVFHLQSQGLATVVFYHPTIPERVGNMAEEADIFRDWALQKQVDFVNLSDVTILASDYRDDIHPDPRGTQKLADAIAKTLTPVIAACRRESGVSGPATGRQGGIGQPARPVKQL